MTMSDVLTLSNPFRMLGVWVNGRQADIVKNLNRAKAFLHVGKTVSFPTDTLLGLPVPQRTEDSMMQAQSALDLPKDRLQLAFFWLGQETPVEKMALDRLAAGDAARAEELLEKQGGWASVLDLAVLALVRNDLDKAVRSYSRLLHEESLRSAFVRAVCGDVFEISEADLTELLWGRLSDAVPFQTLLPYLSGMDATFVREKAVSGHVKLIKAEVAQASGVDSSDYMANRLAGFRLKEQTQEPLRLLKEAVGEDHPDYKASADSVARQVLQCSINYFNGSEATSEDIRIAMDLAEYALSIANGAVVKNRCQMNLDTLKSRQRSAAYQQEMSTIFSLLRPYTEDGGYTGSLSVEAAENLLNSAKPLLSSIKSKSGSEQENYVGASSAVANVCLTILVDVINSLQKYSDKRSIHKVAQMSNELVDSLLQLDISQDARNRLTQNKSTLLSIISNTEPDYSWVWESVAGIVILFLIHLCS